MRIKHSSLDYSLTVMCNSMYVSVLLLRCPNSLCLTYWESSKTLVRGGYRVDRYIPTFNSSYCETAACKKAAWQTEKNALKRARE